MSAFVPRSARGTADEVDCRLVTRSFRRSRANSGFFFDVKPCEVRIESKRQGPSGRRGDGAVVGHELSG